MIYLDHAAATPLDSEVLKAMQPYLHEEYFNASASYLEAKAVSKAIQMARATLAGCLGVRPAEIIFTAGGTEANNLAVQGVMRAFPDGNIVTSPLEHDSVLAPARLFDIREAAAGPSGVVSEDDLLGRIDDKTVLVSVMYANNEIGTIQPITRIARLLAEVRAERKSSGNDRPLYFHTDACQAGNYLHLLADKLGIDLMTINAGKLYGPKQTGALYVKAGTLLQPLILGGGQEWNLRSGTENAANIIGFAKALEIAQSMREEESQRLQRLRQSFLARLAKQLPEVSLTTSHTHVLPNNVHITVPGHDNERLMMALNEAGIVTAVGSACSASSDEPSHVLGAIGLTDKRARSTLRITMGRGTTRAELDETVSTLAKLISFRERKPWTSAHG